MHVHVDETGHDHGAADLVHFGVRPDAVGDLGSGPDGGHGTVCDGEGLCQGCAGSWVQTRAPVMIRSADLSVIGSVVISILLSGQRVAGMRTRARWLAGRA